MPEAPDFYQARCICGWCGPERVSRDAARRDALGHYREVGHAAGFGVAFALLGPWPRSGHYREVGHAPPEPPPDPA